MKAYILLGGLGTRLRPLTNLVPKSLLPLAGKPFLWYQLQLLLRHDIRRAVLGLGYSADKFQEKLDRLQAEWFRDMDIRVVVEKEPLGTGGAVSLAAPCLKEQSFIFNGDVLTNLNLSVMADFHRRTGSRVTIAARSVPDPSRYGLVVFARDGRITEFREKPRNHAGRGWINAGIYIFEPEIIAEIPAGVPYSLEKDFFPTLIDRDIPCFAFPFPETGYWLDIGTLPAYMQAKADVESGRFAF